MVTALPLFPGRFLTRCCRSVLAGPVCLLALFIGMNPASAGLAEADAVMPSLDAGSPASVARVNRPHSDISFERMVDGLLAFSRAFRGKVWLEVFVLAGMNDDRDEVECIASIVEKMRPNRV